MQNLIFGKKNLTSTLHTSSMISNHKENYSTKTILHSINKSQNRNLLPGFFDNHSKNNRTIVWPPVMNDLDALFEEYQNDYGSLRYFYTELVDMHINDVEPLLGTKKTDPELIKLCKGVPDLKWKVFQKLEDMQDALVNVIAKNFDTYSESTLLSVLQTCIDSRHKVMPNSLEAIEHETLTRAIRKALHPEFSIVAIPNRGLIAKKVIHIAKQKGYITVLVCHPDEKNSPAANAAHHVIYINNPQDINELMDALNTFKANEKLSPATKIGIHPGYGYLSENPELPKACENNNMVFIGPSAASMQALGNKSSARITARELSIPVVPGYDGENQDRTFLMEKAQEIGFPIMVKSTDGGGGTGNRVVESMDELSYVLTQSLKGEVVLEKYLVEPQHYEVQLIIDKNEVVFLGTRDCSLQRRYQKIIEIAPAETDQMTEMLHYAMWLGEKARTMGYTGPVTMEFLQQGNQLYFNESNTRIQVEHPITEDILGNVISIIAMQLHIANNKTINHYLQITCKLTASQLKQSSQDIVHTLAQNSPTKVSIEDRINAFEHVLGDDNELLDSPIKGIITTCILPDTSNKGCIDSGVAEGTKIDTFNINPTIMLVRGWGTNRQQALDNLDNIVSNIQITGIDTNINYLQCAHQHISKQTREPHIESCKEIDNLHALQLLAEKRQEATPHLSTNRC